ncbi:MAG: zinc transporter, family [Clostridia bacterium]|nr:zinc transporter, family [Clostridia bacterium]
MEILLVTVLGLLAGVIGTGLGGVIGVFCSEISEQKISVLLGFSAGIMLMVISLDLMPEALELSGMWVSVLGLIIGSLVIAALDVVLPHVHISGEDEHHARLKRTGIVLVLGIALHNLPEGLAIGAGSMHEKGLGLFLAAMIALQNVPEGMAMSIPLRVARTNVSKILFAAFFAGLPMGLGAFLGQYFGGLSENFLAFSLSFAAGAMLFITCDELIPEANNLSKHHSATFGIMVGVITGIILSGLISV